MARKPLGRGLSALLGEPIAELPETNTADSSITGLAEIDISMIEGNPEQPRTRFDEKSLDELSASIAVNGIVQPIVLRKHGERYQIVAGERRWRAAQRAGLRSVPAVIKDVADDKILEIALIENIQRQELNPIEEANAYKNLIEQIGLTQEELAARVGKERSLIATSIRLLKLPSELQQLIEEGKLTAGHGRALLLTNDRTIQVRTARAMIEKQMSVREAERTVKRASVQISTNVPNKRVSLAFDPNVKYAETKLMRTLGTNVKIRPSGKEGAGTIEIEYYNNDDLERIYQKIITNERGEDVRKGV